MSEYLSTEEWRTEFDKLPGKVKDAIWERALSACPDCGIRGVPVSWAVVTAQTLAVDDALE